MEQENAHSVLQRLLRSAGEAAVSSAVTPTRALRLAMARAAESSVGLTLSVLSVTEESMPLDEALKAFGPELMLLALGRGGAPVGIAALDLQLRTATVEVQTLGTLRAEAAADRKVTKADAALCAPLVSGFLTDLAATSQDTPLEGWADAVEAGVMIDDARAAGMILEDCVMRLVRLSLEFGGGERQGELIVAISSGSKVQAPKGKASPPDFSQSLRRSVMEAPAQMHAVLHRLRLTLRDLERFNVGQILPLPGVTVGSVRLEGPDGACVGRARLGQVTGLRAVRLEEGVPQQMSEAAISQHLDEAIAVAGAVGAVEATGDAGMSMMDDPAAMMPMGEMAGIAGDGADPGDFETAPAEDAAPPEMMDPAAGFGDGITDEPDTEGFAPEMAQMDDDFSGAFGTGDAMEPMAVFAPEDVEETG